MQFRKLTLILLAFFAVSAHARTRFFSCENNVSKTSIFFLVQEKFGELQAHLDYGNGLKIYTPTYALLTKAEAKKNPFTALLADEILDVDWSKVSEVELYEIGDYESDAAGALGVNYFGKKDDLVAKGMFIGWGGPMGCKRVIRKPK